MESLKLLQHNLQVLEKKITNASLNCKKLISSLHLDFGQTLQAPEIDLGAKHLQYVGF